MIQKIDIIRSYYEPKLQSGGPDYKVLGWESQQAQEARFSALVEYVPLEGKSLLDVGCGLGSLLTFLKKSKIKLTYTGVDLLEEMVSCARVKHPEDVFLCLDIFQVKKFKPRSFDVVYASGIFNLDLGGDNTLFIKKAMIDFLEISRGIVVMNFLHKKSPTREKQYFYTSPEQIVGFLEELPIKVKSIRIVEQYLQNDFTVICEKCRFGDKVASCRKKREK